MKDRNSFTLVEILFVVLIIGLLAMLAVPNFTKATSITQKYMCINNLRRIELAKEQWGLENGKTAANPAPLAADLDPYIKDGTASVVCPADPAATFSTSYTINVLGTKAACKISPATHHL